MSEFKTCPFCRDDAKETWKIVGNQTFHLVCCQNDDCAGSYDIGPDGANGYISRKFAVDEWNNRA